MKIRITETRVHYHELEIEDDIDLYRLQDEIRQAAIHNSDIADCVLRSCRICAADLEVKFSPEAEGYEIQRVECDCIDDY